MLNTLAHLRLLESLHRAGVPVLFTDLEIARKPVEFTPPFEDSGIREVGRTFAYEFVLIPLPPPSDPWIGAVPCS